MITTVRRLIGRARDWGREQLGTLTGGQRWTSGVALGLAILMVTVGLPDNTRVIAGPPRVRPPIVVDFVPPPTPAPPSIALPPLATPPAPRAPAPPRGGNRRRPPPPVAVNHCLKAAPLGFFTYPEQIPALAGEPMARMIEQLAAVQATYEETTGQPLGVDLRALVAFATGCSDALPNADALVALAETLAGIYEALEAAGVPPIDLPDPPVVPLPDIPAPLQPVVAALAPAVLPICDGISTVLALTPLAGTLLPFDSTEILPYLWPVRATCGLFRAAVAAQAESVREGL